MRAPLPLVGLLGLSASVAACQPGDFEDLAGRAPVVAIDSSAPYPSGTFGVIVGTYRTDLPTTGGGTVPVSRIVVGTGLLALSASEVDGIIGSYSAWNGGSLDLGRKIFARCAGANGSCPPDTGTTAVGLSGIGGELGCVLAGAPGAFDGSTGSYLVATCETHRSVFVVAGAEPPDGLGTALASFPSAMPYGVALAGAPARGPTGSIVLVPDSLVPDPSAPTFGQESLGLQVALPGFGRALTSAALPASQTLTTLASPTVVAATTGAEAGSARVVIFAVGTRDVGGVATTTAEPLGCLDLDEAGGEGTVLAFGDVVEDDLPELFLSARADIPGRSSTVRILSLASLSGASGAPTGCASTAPDDDPPTSALECTDGAGGSTLACSGAGYGASLAIGDANGDGKGDLLVGAPYSLVGGKANAGAAYLHPGGTGLGAPVVLTDSAPRTNDTLGISVAFVASQIGTDQPPRAEPVAGAPGHGAVYVFLCSGLDGDTPTGDAPRCIVQN